MNSEGLSKAIAEVGRRRKPRRWNGYSLDELRTQRVIVQARILIERNRLEMAYGSIKERRAQDKSMLKRILGALNVIDYGVMAIGLVRKVNAIVAHMRNK